MFLIFFNLLLNHHVNQLIRLTPAYEGKVQKTAPYWKNRTSHSTPLSLDFLNVPQSTQGTGTPYPIEYYVMEDWLDEGPGNPGKLLDLVLQVKKHWKPKSLLACHCSSGVSRTGTFLAAFLLVHQMDQKQSISIEKTVSQLSLMRPHAVGKPSQYLTLYRLVDLYQKKLNSQLK